MRRERFSRARRRAALVASLGLLFAAMVVVFATGSSITLALWLMVAAGVAALPFALRRGRPRPDHFWLAVLGAGVLVGLLLWRVAAGPVG